MIRQPNECGRDAWKRWLSRGARLFDRTFFGWAIIWWLFSAIVVYAINMAGPYGGFAGILFLSAASAAAFGVHIAVFDVLASGKRGISPWISAIGKDLSSRRNFYLRSAIIRSVCVGLSIPLVGFFLWAIMSAGGATVPPENIDQDTPFWKSWSIWGWMWIIPAGWQRGGALGWGHWLIRREGQTLEATESLVRLGIALNGRSYSITLGCLLVPALILMMVFPPLLPLWELYAAAVCWCVWDEVFGANEGIKEQEKVAASVNSGALSV